MTCYSSSMKRMIDTLCSPCLSSSSTEKANRVATFRQMNKVSLTTLVTQTTINGLRNTSSTTINYPQCMFIPPLTQWTQQHLVPNKLPMHLTVLSLSRAHFPINECGVLNLQIRWDLIPVVDIHFLWSMEQCLCIEKCFFNCCHYGSCLLILPLIFCFFYCFDDSNNSW